MAYLLMSAVFLLFLHTSVCEEEHEYSWSVTTNDRERCPANRTDDLCRAIRRAAQDLQNSKCPNSSMTGIVKKIEGPDYNVIDGHTDLTLRCPETNQNVTYEWFTPCTHGNDTDRCNTTRPVCTFQPKRTDDNKNVTCHALNSTGHPLYIGYYELNLKYPPQQAPNIKTPQGQTVKAGSKIECNVTGGKPPVANVKLKCVDQQDLLQVGDTHPRNGVSSTRIVAIQVALKVMNCTCTAYWEPEPEFYTKSTQKYVYVSAGKQPATRASGFVVAALIVVVLLCVM